MLSPVESMTDDATEVISRRIWHCLGMSTRATRLEFGMTRLYHRLFNLLVGTIVKGFKARVRDQPRPVEIHHV